MTHTHSNDSFENPQPFIIESEQADYSVAVCCTATVGRDNESDIVLESLTVSRCHAVLLRDATGVLLLDMESTNGTFVNGVFVSPDTPVRLTHADLIRFGTVLVRYLAPTLNSIPQPTPADERGRPLQESSRLAQAARITIDADTT